MVKHDQETHTKQIAAAAWHAGTALRHQDEGKLEEAQADMMAGLFTLYQCGCNPKQWPNLLQEIFATPWLVGAEAWLKAKDLLPEKVGRVMP